LAIPGLTLAEIDEFSMRVALAPQQGHVMNTSSINEEDMLLAARATDFVAKQFRSVDRPQAHEFNRKVPLKGFYEPTLHTI
jgi:hypothetical protein